MKACVRIAVPCCDTCAMPLSLRPRCMPCRACRCMSLCLKRIEVAMLNIFIMTVQFHADRWDGCAVHAMSPGSQYRLARLVSVIRSLQFCNASKS